MIAYRGVNQALSRPGYGGVTEDEAADPGSGEAQAQAEVQVNLQ